MRELVLRSHEGGLRPRRGFKGDVVGQRRMIAVGPAGAVDGGEDGGLVELLWGRRAARHHGRRAEATDRGTGLSEAPAPRTMKARRVIDMEGIRRALTAGPYRQGLAEKMATTPQWARDAQHLN